MYMINHVKTHTNLSCLITQTHSHFRVTSRTYNINPILTLLIYIYIYQIIPLCRCLTPKNFFEYLSSALWALPAPRLCCVRLLRVCNKWFSPLRLHLCLLVFCSFSFTREVMKTSHPCTTLPPNAHNTRTHTRKRKFCVLCANCILNRNCTTTSACDFATPRYRHRGFNYSVAYTGSARALLW